MAEIYALYSGRNGRVRYVGQTTGLCTDRFEQHKRSPSANLYKWFNNEWRDGYPVECARLESCDHDVRSSVERQWMARFPGLLNERMSFRIWMSAHCGKPPKVPEINAYMRRYLFNVNGFRGVCYDRHWDCYQVLIYTGFAVEWLLGDEMMPGWGGNIYFSDLTAAVKARDNDRKWRKTVKYPRDIEMSEDEPFSTASCPTSISHDTAILEDA